MHEGDQRVTLIPLGLQTIVFRSFAAAEPAWRGLEERGACYAFQTFEWLSSWQATIGASEGVEPHIVVVSDEDGAAMLLPLGIRRRSGVAFLSFLGGKVTDYHAPIIRRDFAEHLEPERFDVLWTAVLRQLPPVDIVQLQKMPPLIETTANPFVLLSGSIHTENAHAAKLEGSYQEYREGLKRRLKESHANWHLADSRRRRRRLSEIGKLTYQIATDAAAAQEIMRATVPQKIRRWQETDAPNLFNSPKYLEFYGEMGAKGVPSGLVHISALRVDNTIIATHWSTVFRGRYCALLMTFEAEEWAKYSPGRLIIEDTIEWCFSHDISIFDLTNGDEPYKEAWTDHRLPLYDCVNSLTLRGKSFVALNQLRRKMTQYPTLRPVTRLLRPLRRYIE
jgi:CelD/BcsL family acetyltransferase involved in cellulose biosynthesis